MRSPPSPEVTSRARSVWSTGRRRPTSADAGPHERLDDGGVAAGVVVEVGRNQRAAGEAVAPLPEAASQRQGPAAGVAGGVVELMSTERGAHRADDGVDLARGAAVAEVQTVAEAGVGRDRADHQIGRANV